MVDYLGWAATAVFVSSYFCTSTHALRRVQMIGAVMWMAYAVVMHAAPVFVANLLVLVAAAWTMARSSRGRTMASLGTVSGANEAV
jgi:Bacterial inner membrane protein